MYQELDKNTLVLDPWENLTLNRIILIFAEPQEHRIVTMIGGYPKM